MFRDTCSRNSDEAGAKPVYREASREIYAEESDITPDKESLTYKQNSSDIEIDQVFTPQHMFLDKQEDEEQNELDFENMFEGRCLVKA